MQRSQDAAAAVGAALRIGLLLGVSGVVACSMTPTDVKPLPPYVGIAGPVIIAHRGGSLEAPENTLAAVRHGLTVGADWVEIDVTLSSDDVPVVIHDDSVDRTTNASGAVGMMSVAALQRLHIGHPRLSDAHRERLAAIGVSPPDFGDRFAAETIPTLEQVLEIPDARVMIELKRIAENKVERLAHRVVEVIARTEAWDRVGVASFDEALLWAVRGVDPSIALVGICDSVDGIKQMLSLPVVALAVRIDHVGDAIERRARGVAVCVGDASERCGRSVAVWAWTIYSAEMAKAAVGQGADGVITDVPTAVVAALRPEPSLYVKDAPDASEQAPGSAGDPRAGQ